MTGAQINGKRKLPWLADAHHFEEHAAALDRPALWRLKSGCFVSLHDRFIASRLPFRAERRNSRFGICSPLAWRLAANRRGTVPRLTFRRRTPHLFPCGSSRRLAQFAVLYQLERKASRFSSSRPVGLASPLMRMVLASQIALRRPECRLDWITDCTSITKPAASLKVRE